MPSRITHLGGDPCGGWGLKQEKRRETLVVVADDPIRVRHFLAALTTHATAVIAIVSIIKDQYGNSAIGLITRC